MHERYKCQLFLLLTVEKSQAWGGSLVPVVIVPKTREAPRCWGQTGPLGLPVSTIHLSSPSQHILVHSKHQITVNIKWLLPMILDHFS